MIEFLQLQEETRRLLISQVNIKKGMTTKSIEKDWWVTLVLKALFSLPMASHFIFKGGTSLSKGWKLTERFSEDIDIALAPEAFGRVYKENPSHSYVKQLKKVGCAYTTTTIKEALEKELKNMGVPEDMVIVEADPVNPTFPDKDPQTLYVRYRSLYEPNDYLGEPVKIEFGVRALREPFSTVPIQSIIGEESATKAYAEEPFPVTVVAPHKTFMEKLFLLHEKFLTGRAEGDAGERQSRHLYDLVQMINKGIDQQVVEDAELYRVLLDHRSAYVRLKNVDYAAMQPGQLGFIPPRNVLENFRKDYSTMRTEMIFGDSPEFDDLIRQLRKMNEQFAGIGHQINISSVIVQAYQQLEKEKDDWDFQSTIVHYNSDLRRPIGPDNLNISFEVEFIKETEGLIFHRIRIR